MAPNCSNATSVALQFTFPLLGSTAFPEKDSSASSTGWVQLSCQHHACQRDLKPCSFLGPCATSLYCSHRQPELKIQVPIHPTFPAASSAMALIGRVFGEPCKELAFVMAGGCKKGVEMCPCCRLSAALSKPNCCRLPEMVSMASRLYSSAEKGFLLNPT